MFDLSMFSMTILVLFTIAAILWFASYIKHDVGIVDSFWSLLILSSGLCFMFLADTMFTDKQLLVITLLSLWAIRLAFYISWRNWGEEEDSRYQTIRENNQPYFEYKSLYIVFLLQAFLAVIVALPLMSVFSTTSDIQLLDYIAIALWVFGMFFEVTGDWQLSRFKSDVKNDGKVLDSGVWKYTRHPNYFGEFCIWWSFYLFAISSGYMWSIISPILMTILLLKVSGVSLLESTISERRPGYDNYRNTTNAFFPWLPKKITHKKTMGL